MIHRILPVAIRTTTMLARFSSHDASHPTSNFSSADELRRFQELNRLIDERTNGKFVTKDDLNLRLKETERALETRMDKMETSFNTRMDRMEASFNTRMDKIEKSMEKMEASFNTRMDRMEASFNTRMDKMDASFSARLGKTEKATDEKIEKMAKGIKTDIKYWVLVGVGGLCVSAAMFAARAGFFGTPNRSPILDTFLPNAKSTEKLHLSPGMIPK